MKPLLGHRPRLHRLPYSPPYTTTTATRPFTTTPPHLQQQQQQQPPYLQQQPPYLQQQPPYLQQQPSYLQQQPSYLQQQPPYLQQQPSYLQQQPPPTQHIPPPVKDEGSATPYSRRISRTGLFVTVPHGERWVVERFGRYHRTLEPGLNFLVPWLDHVSYVHLFKEQTFTIASQAAITRDNVQIHIDGILYFRIQDAYRASYGVEQPLEALANLAQTTMRAELGRITLDKTISDRQTLNASIVQEIAKSCSVWGITVQRYEIRDITVPQQIREAMELESAAERRKRQTILNSEAERTAAENIAFGRKIATQLLSEAMMVERQNQARGEAFAIEAKAEATAEAINTLAEAIGQPQGEHAVSYRVAQEWISAFAGLAQGSNTMILPANASDASSMTAQAIAIYDNLVNKQREKASEMGKDQALEHVLGDLGLQQPGKTSQQGQQSLPQKKKKNERSSDNSSDGGRTSDAKE